MPKEEKNKNINCVEADVMLGWSYSCIRLSGDQDVSSYLGLFDLELIIIQVKVGRWMYLMGNKIEIYTVPRLILG